MSKIDCSLQWFGSGEERCIATAQLKLLLSFTPIPAHASNPAPPGAELETGYLSSSSGSSEGLSSASPPSDNEQSAELSSENDAAPEPSQYETGTEGEGTSSARSPRRHLKQAPRRMTTQRVGKSETGHDQKQRPPRVRSAAAVSTQQSSNTPDMTSSHTHSDQMVVVVPAPENRISALTVLNAESSSRPERPSAQAETVVTGMPCLTPEQAISRLIQRAEQLREMIGVTATENFPRANAARIGTSDLQHASAAATSPVICASMPHHGMAGIAEPAQASHDANTITGGVRQKRVHDRVAPASKLRRLAQGRLQQGASSTQGVINSPQAQVKGFPRPVGGHFLLSFRSNFSSRHTVRSLLFPAIGFSHHQQAKHCSTSGEYLDGRSRLSCRVLGQLLAWPEPRKAGGSIRMQHA